MIDSEFKHVFWQAAAAVVNANMPRPWYADNPREAGPHHWFGSLRGAFDLHPVIDRAVEDGYRPVDWQQLLLEWPHVSMDDESQIAYTRNEDAGRDFPENGSKRQTRTSIGKYLSRHWPHVPDHVRRDWAGRFSPAKYAIWDTVEGIISGVELGPVSCMHSDSGSIPFRSHDNIALVQWHSDKTTRVQWHHHTYACYAPEYGWRMAVRLNPMDPLDVQSRALVNVSDAARRRNKDAVGVFVRSFSKCPQGGYSHSDDKLEAWLTDQGYVHVRAWPNGVRLAHHEHPREDGFMAPYIDGDTDTVDNHGSYLEICSDGAYTCTQQDGTAAGQDREDYIGTCEACDDSIYEDDDHTHAGPDGDGGTYCCSCTNRRLTRVTGAPDGDGRAREYYVRNGDVVSVNGDAYDRDNLPDHIIVREDGEHDHEDNCAYCDDGEYREIDECACVDGEWYAKSSDVVVQCVDDEYRLRNGCVCVDGGWYEADDDEIVQCADGYYHLRDDCWQCAHNEEWYPDSEPHVEIGDAKYHPASLREMAVEAEQSTQLVLI